MLMIESLVKATQRLEIALVTVLWHSQSELESIFLLKYNVRKEMGGGEWRIDNANIAKIDLKIVQSGKNVYSISEYIWI